MVVLLDDWIKVLPLALPALYYAHDSLQFASLIIHI